MTGQHIQRLLKINKKIHDPIKNGPKTLTGSSSKEIHMWEINIWKDVPHHMSSEKCKLKWGLTTHLFSSVQFSSVAQSCLTLCDPMNHSTPGLLVHHQLPELTQTHVHGVGDAIQPSHPLSSPSPPAPNPPSIRVFSNESTLHMRWPKYWSFSFNVSPSNEPRTDLL